jgi:hypothetical protein
MKSVRYLDKGSTEERAALVIKSLLFGWQGRSNKEYGAYLLDPADGEILVVPRDVMEYLIGLDIMYFEREH